MKYLLGDGGIVYLINDSTNKMICLGILVYA